MKIAAYLYQGHPGVGRVSADGRQVEPFQVSAEQAALGALPLVEAQAAGRALPPTGQPVSLQQVQLLAPIPRPRRNIFCVGKNYHAHAKEFAGSGFDSSAKSGGDIPAAPIIFSKVPESVTGPSDPILFSPEVSTAIDYEAELTIVIGQGGKGIRKADAMKHVWGYTIINDVTARDWQGRHSQWLLGKSFDTFCPMGPWLVSADEMDGQNTDVKCWVNGELRQDANTKDFIFDIPTLIECISAGITLYPGDLIATGTPAGVGIGYKPPKYLKSGDVVKIEIGGIGVIENPLRG
ncbi:fumarylacetoacetate hydrolase family protein [Ramlibacter ginsenosidimutans]|uniref:Fumarylacetoacetate hydrolase family protein n=1 Tax=Ramlibacter ginsenosidimutans TaxID=502333 RepID=A0A934TQF9_9BURK|nr:fumarylacetoacetate hydrolase family protein [Ramlibacter ginsenosidimutans]MBK6005260.1 fumarylacetoacetate hydrolase family protein [Ramlibacter ginsenosidimutans]